MRYSKQRELVMQTVENLCDHPTAEEIYDTAAKECLYCTVCGGVTDAEVDEKQVTKLVRGQKGRVQDCAVVFIGVCESCCAAQKAASEA